MEMGVVTGRLRLSSQIGELEGRQVLFVQTQQKEIAAQALVDARVGDRVLVARNSRLQDCFVGAAVVAVVENANCS